MGFIRSFPPDMLTKERPRKNTARRWLPISQGERSHQKQTFKVPWSWPSCIQSCERIIFGCLSHAACGIAWHPQQTNAIWLSVPRPIPAEKLCTRHLWTLNSCNHNGKTHLWVTRQYHANLGCCKTILNLLRPWTTCSYPVLTLQSLTLPIPVWSPSILTDEHKHLLHKKMKMTFTCWCPLPPNQCLLFLHTFLFFCLFLLWQRKRCSFCFSREPPSTCFRSHLLLTSAPTPWHSQRVSLNLFLLCHKKYVCPNQKSGLSWLGFWGLVNWLLSNMSIWKKEQKTDPVKSPRVPRIKKQGSVYKSRMH